MGSYKTPDGRTVNFTDDSILRDVADLYAIVDGDYKNTPSSTSEALKTMLGELQAGKPLSDMEWTLFNQFMDRYGDELSKFRASKDNDTEGLIPVGDVGSGRITEAYATLPPSTQERLREGYSIDTKTPSTTPLDRQLTIAHLFDSVKHDMSHTIQHAKRLGDPDVKASPKSMQFNIEHMSKHLQSAADHLERLGFHMSKNPHDPQVFASERKILQKQREAKPKIPDIKAETTTPIESNPATLCIDFDGVIHQGPHGLPGKVEGTIVEGAPEAIKKLSQKFRLVVLTARVDIHAVRLWLDQQGLAPYISDVTNRKPSASAYIDDRATHFSNWPNVMQAVDPDIPVTEEPVSDGGKPLSQQDIKTPHGSNTLADVNLDANKNLKEAARDILFMGDVEVCRS